MKKNYIIATLLLLSAFTVFLSCGSDDSGEYREVSPVVMDLTTVPYPKLSDYKFFVGEIKKLEPAYKVLPYDLNSSLFTDYALKKRFVWMPEGTKATYTADGEVLNFPVGAALIKNFYYDNVLPGNVTRIIETRIMIKKTDGWIFANYKWNEEQTEAFLDMNASSLDIKWLQNGEEMNVTYKIPEYLDCARCHSDYTTFTPIGPKPQNLSKNFIYPTGAQNQLAKWKEEGYLESFPENITVTVDWNDTGKSLDLRARSYLDINCAHCHKPGGACDLMPENFSFTPIANPVSLGVCVEPHDFFIGNEKYIIMAQRSQYSLLYSKVVSTDRLQMMPPVGRTLHHKEGTDLIMQWINDMETSCP
ncbi:hypothetical protein ACX0HA_00945 [Flavobacterium hauense]